MRLETWASENILTKDELCLLFQIEKVETSQGETESVFEEDHCIVDIEYSKIVNCF